MSCDCEGQTLDELKQQLLNEDCKTCDCGRPAVEIRHVFNGTAGPEMVGVCARCHGLWEKK